MTEWLLSGHNTQESSGVEHPLTISIHSSGWFEELRVGPEIAGDFKDFDSSLPAVVPVQGRLYVNMTYYMRNAVLAIPLDPEALGVAKELFRPYGKMPLRRRLLFPWRMYRYYRWDKSFYDQRMESLADQVRGTYRLLREQAHSPIDAIEAFFEPAFLRRLAELDKAHVATTMFVTVVDTIIREKRPELLGLFIGIHTTTSMMAERIWELREVAQQCGPAVTEKLKAGVTELDVYRQIPEAQPFVSGVEAFLRQYGHRGFRYELDLDTLRLDDRPEHVMLAIAGQLDVLDAPLERSAESRRKALRELEALPTWEKPFWKWMLQWGQQLISWREQSKSLFAMKQAVIALAARHLSRLHYPNKPEDSLLFYTFDEFLDFVHSRGKKAVSEEVLSRRRAEYELYVTQAPPPELIWYDPDSLHWRPVEFSVEKTGGMEVQTARHFRGIPVSAGSGPVEGVALVTGDPVEAGQRLLTMEGDVILVTRFTDPAWSSLFGRLTGVVTELGGVISHAAVVARENGLPAVVGVKGILRAVRNGRRLRIDGKSGEIVLLED